MRNATILALTLVSFGLMPAACGQNFDFFSSSQGSGGAHTGSSSSGTMSSSSSSSTSSSGNPACKVDSDCPNTNPCATVACTGGTCTSTSVADGTTPAGYVDMVKDCKTQSCMGGTEVTVADDTDVPPPANNCETTSCSMMMVVTANVAQGMSCGGNNQICDGNGNCVGCNMASDCNMPGTCKTVACTNHACVVSNDASGTACTSGGGGKFCDNGGNCVPCVKDSNCTGANPSDICINNQCASSCNDGMKDGTETGTDCGGACPTKCPNNQGCNTGNDCASGYCNNGTCNPAPNGHACNQTSQCVSGNTCVSNVCCDSACNTGTCQACLGALTGGADGHCTSITAGMPAPSGQCTAATCGNTGKCAAGGTCATVSTGSNCGNGPGCTGNVYHPQQTCTAPLTCGGATQDCLTYKCSNANGCPATCSTNAQCSTGNYCNGSNACVALIPDGSACTASAQCLNGFCTPTTMLCLTPTCSDGFQDGTETDIDCGGATCSKCGSTKKCLLNSDCTSNHCLGNNTCM